MRHLWLVAALILEGCTLDQVVASCADCGEIRSIEMRPVPNQICLPTAAPVAQAVSLRDAPQGPLVYDVRIHMDRGGSRDLELPDLGALRVGDRVEVQGRRVLRRADPNTGPLWL